MSIRSINGYCPIATHSSCVLRCPERHVIRSMSWYCLQQMIWWFYVRTSQQRTNVAATLMQYGLDIGHLQLATTLWQHCCNTGSLLGLCLYSILSTIRAMFMGKLDMNACSLTMPNTCLPIVHLFEFVVPTWLFYLSIHLFTVFLGSIKCVPCWEIIETFRYCIVVWMICKPHQFDTWKILKFVTKEGDPHPSKYTHLFLCAKSKILFWNW